jgi:hypothetical protein
MAYFVAHSAADILKISSALLTSASGSIPHPGFTAAAATWSPKFFVKTLQELSEKNRKNLWLLAGK